MFSAEIKEVWVQPPRSTPSNDADRPTDFIITDRRRCGVVAAEYDRLPRKINRYPVGEWECIHASLSFDGGHCTSLLHSAHLICFYFCSFYEQQAENGEIKKKKISEPHCSQHKPAEPGRSKSSWMACRRLNRRSDQFIVQSTRLAWPRQHQRQ